MKKIIESNYFSKRTFIFAVLVFCFSFSFKANAQIMSYGGTQLMFWPAAICNNNSGNVHFILDGERLLSLYSPPSIRTYGDSSVEFGTNQVGTYLPVPMPCIVNISGAPVTIWVSEGTYIDASTGYGMKDKFFAGAVDPFIKKINLNT